MGKIDQMNNKKLAQLQALIQQSEKKLADARAKSEKGLKKDLAGVNELLEDHSRRLTALAKNKGGGGRGSSVMASKLEVREKKEEETKETKPEAVVDSEVVSQKSKAKEEAGPVAEEAASVKALSGSKTPPPTEAKEVVATAA